MVEPTPAREPLAIVGIGCRFPGGAHGPQELWKLLCEGVDAITEVPPDRWAASAFYDPDPSKPGKALTRWGGFVQQRIEEFDALFFGISPREAAYLDPMQRWLLEVTWEALDDAGEVPDRLVGTDTGVYVGIFTEDIKLLQLGESNRDLIDGYSAGGAAMTMAANRISYLFDLRGPSLALDTACSSSLVAAHLACQSLWRGECSRALVGGANAMFKPEYSISNSKAGMLSPDGRCKAFDARANGYVRAEGAGMVVIKPLSAALADKNPVYALIRSTASNQDGRTIGITVPSGPAQQALLRQACSEAEISPGDIRFVEAHGTGTPVGDPIEMVALAEVLATDRSPDDECLIGSIKTNIGHLEAAAGIAGLIKASLCLKHGLVPPHLHLEQPNPQIPFEQLCVRVPKELEAIPAGAGPALAGVNSFGFGGSNAHVILQEPPPAPSDQDMAADDETAPRLIPLSARCSEGLKACAALYRDHLNSDANAPSLANLAHTAANRRSHHRHRLAVVARSTHELVERLDAYLDDGSASGLSVGSASAGAAPRIAFVFSGMGPQWWAMGRQLLDSEPVFREAVVRCDEELSRHADWSILAELTRDEASSRMAETQIAQPANYVLQVGLWELFRSWGVHPDAIIGHSAGEVAALYAAGVYSFPDAAKVIYHRSRIQHKTTGMGKLVAVRLDADEAAEAIAPFEGRVSIAAINSPKAITLVGDEEALGELVDSLKKRDVFCRFLKVEVPYHSHYMDPLRDELLQCLDGIDPQPPQGHFVSTVTGERAQEAVFDPEYWWRNVRHPVLFVAGVRALAAAGFRNFLEISPHPVLAGSIKEILSEQGRDRDVVTTLRREQPEKESLLDAVGKLYCFGLNPDWESIQPDGHLVRLPRYPWQRQECWQESEASRLDRYGVATFGGGDSAAVSSRLAADVAQPAHPLLGRRLRSAHPVWETLIDRSTADYLEDHNIQGTVVLPGAAFIEMALAAGRQLAGSDTVTLENLRFRKALFLPEGAVSTVQTSVEPRRLSYSISSAPREGSTEWLEHACGEIHVGPQGSRPQPLDLEELKRRCPEESSPDNRYDSFQELGFHYGPTFRGISRLWQGKGEALARLRLASPVADELGRYSLHPVALDVGFQTLIACAISELGNVATTTYLPVGGDTVRLYSPPVAEMWAYCRLSECTQDRLEGDLWIVDDDGQVVVHVRGVRAISLDSPQLEGDTEPHDLLYEVDWRVMPGGLAAQQGADETGFWLVLADDRGTGTALADQLQSRGVGCVKVRPGPEYSMSEDGRSAVVDPADEEQLNRLFAAVQDRPDWPCRGIVSMWALDVPPVATTEGAELLRVQTTMCITVARLVQALARADWPRWPRLWLVTRGSQAVGADGEPPPAVEHAALWGFGLTLGHQEQRKAWGGLIDLDQAAPDGEAAALAELLLAGSGEDQIALRGAGHEVWIPRLARRRDLGEKVLGVRLRSDGTYLLTGGLGGLGLKVAQWMVEHGARRLILLSRSGLPERSEWGLRHQDGVAGRIAAVRQLESMGASVHVAAVDISDYDAMADYLQRFRAQGWPPVRGVMHLAGLSSPQLTLRADEETFASDLAPKVMGGLVLHRLFDQDDLDFFVLFSSIAALGFSLGQSAYASGNAFLDALAHHRRGHGLPAASYNWGAWGEVGMGALLDLEKDFVRRGLPPMAPSLALEAMARLLSRDPVQVAITRAFWQTARQNNYPAGQAPPLLEELIAEQETAATDTSARPEEAQVVLADIRRASPGDRPAMLQGVLHDLVTRILRLSRSQLDPEQSLSSLGLDSIVAVEIKERVESSLGVTVSVLELLEGASVNKLAEQLMPRVQALIDGAAQGEDGPSEDSAGDETADVDAEVSQDQETPAAQPVMVAAPHGGGEGSS